MDDSFDGHGGSPYGECRHVNEGGERGHKAQEHNRRQREDEEALRAEQLGERFQRVLRGLRGWGGSRGLCALGPRRGRRASVAGHFWGETLSGRGGDS